LAAWDNKK